MIILSKKREGPPREVGVSDVFVERTCHCCAPAIKSPQIHMCRHADAGITPPDEVGGNVIVGAPYISAVVEASLGRTRSG